MIPEAIYRARASAIGIQETMTGKTYVSADFDVEVEGSWHKVEWRGWLTEAAEARTIESLRAMGWYGDDVFELQRDGALRMEVDIDVRHEEWKGKTTPRVAFVNAPQANPEERDKKRREMAARVRKAAAKTKPAGPPPDDDLGF